MLFSVNDVDDTHFIRTGRGLVVAGPDQEEQLNRNTMSGPTIRFSSHSTAVRLRIITCAALAPQRGHVHFALCHKRYYCYYNHRFARGVVLRFAVADRMSVSSRSEIAAQSAFVRNDIMYNDA